MRHRETLVCAAALAALFAAPLYLGAYNLALLGRFLAMSILAVGIVLVWGNAGILPLGQGIFFGLGGYAVAMHLKLVALGAGQIPDFMQWDGLNSLPWFWVPFANGGFALIAALLLPALAAAALAWLLFRRRVGGVYFAIITQALALATTTFIVSQQPYTGGFNGLTDFSTGFGVTLTDEHTQVGLYLLTVAMLAATFVGVRWLLGTQFGKLLRAIREGENRVRFLGYDSTPYKLVAFAIGALLAGLAGVLFTLNIGVISPAMIGVVPSIEMVVWVAVGGRESLMGAVLGTLIVNFGKDQVSSIFPEAWLFAMGALFILVTTVLPDGLGGVIETLIGGEEPEMRRTLVLDRVPSADEVRSARIAHEDGDGRAAPAVNAGKLME